MAEHGQLAGADGTAIAADVAVAVHHVDEGVELGAPRQRHLRAGRDGGVHHRHRRVGAARALDAVDLTGDDADERAGVVRGAEPHVAGADVLVVRREPLGVARQVDPQLEPVEQAALGDEPLGRGLDVEQPASGGHPLGVAVGDRTAAAVAVLVVEDAVDHVRHGLEAAVRVPRRALGLARGVLDLTHLVHVDERVEPGRVDAGERAADGESLTLVALRRAGDADGRSVLGIRPGRDGARKDGPVGGGDGRHVHSFVWSLH